VDRAGVAVLAVRKLAGGRAAAERRSVIDVRNFAMARHWYRTDIANSSVVPDPIFVDVLAGDLRFQPGLSANEIEAGVLGKAGFNERP